MKLLDDLVDKKSFRYLIIMFHACLELKKEIELIKVASNEKFNKGIKYLVQVVNAVELQQALLLKATLN